MSEILITGMGIVSAIGNNVEETRRSLLAGRSGIGTMRHLKTTHREFPAGEVKLSNEEMCAMLGISADTPTTRTALMGMLAVKEALENAKIPFHQSNKNPKQAGSKIALISGTTVGGMDKSEQFYIDFVENDSKNTYIAMHDCGACTEMIADYFGIFSQVDTISTACSSAANAILLGAELLRNGKADVVVAGGAECLTKFHLNGFNSLFILDKMPCRPFDASRAGLNLGEGAAYIVMCLPPAPSERRGEKSHNSNLHKIDNIAQSLPFAEGWEGAVLSGYANACDAFHQTASSPDGEGAFLAMKNALENAALRPADIDYINAHGTGTQNNDLSEGRAIERLFGTEIPPVSSTKSFTGHTTSAAGGVEAVISILALHNNFIPPNLNFKNQMEELSFAPVQAGQTKVLRHVLSNSFGFGGNDTALVFSRKDL